LTILVLGGFGVYATWRAAQGANFEWGPYLSPLYAPLFQPDWWPLSPAFLILWAPGGFRATCYYYRKAYYRAFFAHPPGCAVSEPWGHDYRGEHKFPFILQNVHRYFMYIALIFIAILWWDAIKSYMWDDGAGGKTFGIGLGSLIMTLNAFCLMNYTLGCHAFRHLVGGKLDCFSSCTTNQIRHKGWKGVTALTRNHQLWAWVSLFVVGFTDFYIYMLTLGHFSDPRFF
jgi:hypothetical protein